LDETLTLRLRLSERLRRSLATTNPIERLMSRTRHVHRNVKRWRNGKMMIRWMTAAVFEAAKGFRRVKGCKDLPALVIALRRRDEQLGLTKPSERLQFTFNDFLKVAFQGRASRPTPASFWCVSWMKAWGWRISSRST
jgi:hypothetical protein